MIEIYEAIVEQNSDEIGRLGLNVRTSKLESPVLVLKGYWRGYPIEARLGSNRPYFYLSTEAARDDFNRYIVKYTTIEHNGFTRYWGETVETTFVYTIHLPFTQFKLTESVTLFLEDGYDRPKMSTKSKLFDHLIFQEYEDWYEKNKMRITLRGKL